MITQISELPTVQTAIQNVLKITV